MKFCIRKIHTKTQNPVEAVVGNSPSDKGGVVKQPIQVFKEEKTLQVELEAMEQAKFRITTEHVGDIEYFEYDIFPEMDNVLHYKDRIEFNHIDIIANNKTVSNVSFNIHYIAKFK